MLIARYFGWGKGSLAKNRDAPIAWRDVLLTDFVLKCDYADKPFVTGQFQPISLDYPLVQHL